MLFNNGTTSTTIIPYETVMKLNIAHRSIATFVNLSLLILFMIACVTSGTWDCCCGRSSSSTTTTTTTTTATTTSLSEEQEVEKEQGGIRSWKIWKPKSMLLNFTTVFIICRTIAEVIRLIAFTLPSAIFQTTPYNPISRSFVVFFFFVPIVVMALLIECWTDIVAKFIIQPFIQWIVRVLNLLLCTLTLCCAFVDAVFIGYSARDERSLYLKRLGDRLLVRMVYPIYCATFLIMGLQITVIGMSIVIIVRGKLFSLSHGRNIVFFKISSCVIVFWLCSVIRVVLSITLAQNALVKLGEWFTVVGYLVDWIAMLVIGLVFIPLDHYYNKYIRRRTSQKPTKKTELQITQSVKQEFSGGG